MIIEYEKDGKILKEEIEFEDVNTALDPNETLGAFDGESENYPLLASIKNNRECKETNLLTIDGCPESKTEMKTRCVGSGIFRVCADVPVVYRRSCKKKLYAQVCYPNEYKKDAMDCLKVGVAAAIAAKAGGPPAMKEAFYVAIKACLSAKLADRADQVSFKTGTKSDCSRWIPL